MISRYAKAGNLTYYPHGAIVPGKEIWSSAPTPGDLPADFEQRRSANYGELRKPLDPSVFIHDLRSEMTAALDELNTAIPDLAWLDITDRASGAIAIRVRSGPGAV